jgi:hypothetical protein
MVNALGKDAQKMMTAKPITNALKENAELLHAMMKQTVDQVMNVKQINVLL